MVLPQGRRTEQRNSVRTDPTRLRPADFQQGRHDHSVQKEWCLQQALKRKATKCKNETGLWPHTQTKTKPKWARDLNVRAKTIKLLEEKAFDTGCDTVAIVQDTTDAIHLRWETKSMSPQRKKQIHWTSSKLKMPMFQKTASRKQKDNQWEKLLENHISEQGLVFRLYKEYFSSQSIQLLSHVRFFWPHGL